MARKLKARKTSNKSAGTNPSKLSLKEILANLSDVGRNPRFFPRGIEAIHLVTSPDGASDLKILGPHAATVAPAPQDDDLAVGDMVPNKSERDVVGAATTVIKRDTPEFATLVKNTNADIVFKDEEGTGADRMMTTKTKEKLDALAASVKTEWPGSKLRVAEAWDENMEHGTMSVHYEGRAADITTAPVDGTKLGRLGRLAVNSGFEWVFYENELHVHVSMSK